MTDLAPPARLYVLGFCRNDEQAAEAVARVVFQNHTLRSVAKDTGIPRQTLHRMAKEVKAGIAWLLTSEPPMIGVSDLVVRDGV